MPLKPFSEHLSEDDFNKMPLKPFRCHLSEADFFFVIHIVYHALGLFVEGGRVQRVAQHQEAVAERLQECGGGDLCGPRCQDHQVRPRQHLVESQGTSLFDFFFLLLVFVLLASCLLRYVAPFFDSRHATVVTTH